MHRNKCPIMEAYAMLHIDLPPLILVKMKHQFRRHRAVFEGDVQPLGIRFECREICAAPPARIARSETRAGTWCWVRAEMSVYSGRCCRLGIAE